MSANGQYVYICMDDSGKLNKNELYTVFSGLAFTSSEERNRFIISYKKALDKIKCSNKYCKQDPRQCNGMCPEIKSNIIKEDSHRRMLLNTCKHYHTFAAVVENLRVYDHIIRFKEFGWSIF